MVQVSLCWLLFLSAQMPMYTGMVQVRRGPRVGVGVERGACTCAGEVRAPAASHPCIVCVRGVSHDPQRRKKG